MQRFILLLLMLVLNFGVTKPSYAAEGGIIRDTEIEQSLKEWLAPVARAAGMSPQSIRIILIEQNGVNAFVAGGQNIFLYTGLINKAENASEVLGVMAHELGHITGGHLVRKQEDLENASYESVVGLILGLSAAVASGQGEALGTLSRAGQGQALRRLYGASRIYESSADQAALSFLETAKINPNGLLSFMQKLENDELLPASQQSEYNRTHPLTRDRVSALADRVARSANTQKDFPAAWNNQFKRMKAKLTAFITPAQVAWAYDDRDQSIEARYARAIAAYRQNQVDDALRLVNGLITAEPSNPYFYELKGQMLKDFGRLKEAGISYKKAIDLKPDAPLFRIDYAQTLIETNINAAQAIAELKRALQDEPKSARAWRLLATAYGKTGNEAQVQLALAEEALLKRDIDRARNLAEGARTALPKTSRDAVRAQDILNQTENLKQKKAR